MSTISELVKSHLPCPHCDSSDAYSEWDDGHGYCFSCEAYDPPAGKSQSGYTTEYLPWRGISAESFRRYEAKTRVSSNGEPLALALPYPNGNLKLRSISEKKFWSEGEAAPGLFGMDKFDPGENKYLIITEGEIDAVSCWQILQIPACSVRSSSSAVRDVAAAREWVSAFERVYICFDADGPGRDAARGVCQLLDRSRTYDVRLVRHKDANAYLVAGEEFEFRQVVKASKHYMPDTIVSDMASFKRLLEEEPKWGVPYPYSTLNQMTYGIRPGEMVLITAQEGVGKTSLMHAIEHNILRETNDNVAAIYLEETRRQHLEALVGLELGRPVHLPGSNVSGKEKADALERLLLVDDRLHLLEYGGGWDASDLVDTVRFLVAGCGCSFVLLDHFNNIVSGDRGAETDERKQLDYLATVLKMMAIELNFALVGVAHVNDFGATRGSRYLAKAADVRIDLTRDLTAGSSLATLTVSKNRYAAKSGYAGTLKFDFNTYKLSEVANDNGELSNVS